MKRLLTVIIALISASLVFSQSPVDISELQIKDKIYLYNGSPFTGSCYEKHGNGKIGLKGQFKAGMKDGVWTWWYSTGQKKRETTYLDNKKEGITYYWHPNGQKAKELMFRNDKNIDQKLWDENGNRLPNPAFSQTTD